MLAKVPKIPPKYPKHMNPSAACDTRELTAPAGGAAGRVQGKHRLDGDVHGGDVERLEHDLTHLLAVRLGVQGSLGVAVHVGYLKEHILRNRFFARQTLKPVFHFIGSRVGSPGAFKRYGSTGCTTCTAPHLGEQHGVFLGRDAELVVESVVPDLLRAVAGTKYFVKAKRLEISLLTLLSMLLFWFSSAPFW
jgi:hypothetical protein